MERALEHNWISLEAAIHYLKMRCAFESHHSYLGTMICPARTIYKNTSVSVRGSSALTDLGRVESVQRQVKFIYPGNPLRGTILLSYPYGGIHAREIDGGIGKDLVIPLG